MLARSSWLFGSCLAASAAVVLACSSFTGSDAPAEATDGGAGTDAAVGGDALVTTDAGRCLPDAGLAFLAADFEDSPPRYYVMGAAAGLAPAKAPDSWKVDGVTATCGGHSLEIVYASNGFTMEALRDVGAIVHVVTATFDLQLEDLSKTVNDETFATIGIRNPAFDHCYVALQVLSVGSQDIGMQSHCGTVDSNQYRPQVILSPVGLGWLHVVFQLDLSMQTASVAVDGTAAQTMQLKADVAAGGTTVYAQLGTVAPTPATGSSRVRLDNIRVDVR